LPELAPKVLDDSILVEQSLLHLMLHHREVVEEMLQDGVPADLFDPAHRPLVNAIYAEYVRSGRRRLLSDESYRAKLLADGVDGNDLLFSMDLWDKCYVGTPTSLEDFGYLRDRLIEAFTARVLNRTISDIEPTIKEKGFRYAVTQAMESLQEAVQLSTAKRTVVVSIDEMRDDYLGQLQEQKRDSSKIIRCNMPEIDDVVNVGFRPQHLTLFVADVGGHKTNMMLNVALNIYDMGHNVLFIPLEMSRFDLMNRIIANRAEISLNKLAKPHLLSDKEFDEIRDARIWDSESSARFAILDAEDQTSVSSLQYEIEKHSFVFKPAVVVIDYIANLKPDREFRDRNDLEIGQQLKSLRFLGKKFGFHVISAAQLGRDAIRKLRDNQDSSVVDSTAVRGSHEYSADSDTIFGILPVPHQSDTLKIVTIKARHGAKQTSELKVRPEFALIYSTRTSSNMAHQRSKSSMPGFDVTEDIVNEEVIAPEGMEAGAEGPEELRPDRDVTVNWEGCTPETLEEQDPLGF